MADLETIREHLLATAEKYAEASTDGVANSARAELAVARAAMDVYWLTFRPDERSPAEE